MYTNKTLSNYSKDLAAKLPAPGGGSAAALSGCLGASLVCMVLNFTLGKPAYKKYNRELKKALAKAFSLSRQLLKLVDEDILAYSSKNFKKSLSVPIKVCDLCFQGVKIIPGLVNKSNINLISDVAVAIELFEAGFASAYFNVEINLRNIDNPVFRKKIRSDLMAKLKLIRKITCDTEVKIGRIIKR